MKTEAKWNQDKKNIVWNAIAGIVNALEAVIVLAVVSRINGVTEAGIMTLAFSVANLYMTIGKFGVRNYQVAYGEYDYHFSTFVNARIISVAGMIITTIVYLIVQYNVYHITTQKMIALGCVCAWYATEAWEDVYVGKLQAIGRLDVGSIIFSIRWVCIILLFSITDYFTKSLEISLIVALCGGTVLLVVQLLYVKHRYIPKTETAKDGALAVLIKRCIPLFMSGFIYYYLTNLPKYAINSKLTDDYQAVYGYIAMPTFVIPLLNSFVYQPHMNYYVQEWHDKKFADFEKRIKRQILVIIGITLICMVGAFLLGIPVLSWLYNEDLSGYKLHLQLMLIGGGGLAIAGFLQTMLTVIDARKEAFYCYIAATIVEQLFIYKMVEAYNVSGAVYGYMISMLVLAVFVSGMLIVKLHHYKSHREET